jgi:hypothetical protein
MMMESEESSETLVYNSTLTKLIVRDVTTLTDTTQDMVQLLALVNTIMKLQYRKKSGIFLG